MSEQSGTDITSVEILSGDTDIISHAADQMDYEEHSEIAFATATADDSNNADADREHASDAHGLAESTGHLDDDTESPEDQLSQEQGVQTRSRRRRRRLAIDSEDVSSTEQALSPLEGDGVDDDVPGDTELDTELESDSESGSMRTLNLSDHPLWQCSTCSELYEDPPRQPEEEEANDEGNGTTRPAHVCRPRTVALVTESNVVEVAYGDGMYARARAEAAMTQASPDPDPDERVGSSEILLAAGTGSSQGDAADEQDDDDDEGVGMDDETRSEESGVAGIGYEPVLSMEEQDATLAARLQFEEYQ